MTEGVGDVVAEVEEVVGGDGGGEFEDGVAVGLPHEVEGDLLAVGESEGAGESDFEPAGNGVQFRRMVLP